MPGLRASRGSRNTRSPEGSSTRSASGALAPRQGWPRPGRPPRQGWPPGAGCRRCRGRSRPRRLGHRDGAPGACRPVGAPRRAPAFGAQGIVPSLVSPSAAVKSVAVSLPLPPLKRSAPDPPVSRSLPLPPPRLSSPAPPVRVSLPLSPHSRSLPSPPVSVSLLLWAKIRSAPAPPVSVSLPLPPTRTVTSTVPLACPSLTVTVRIAVPLRPSTVLTVIVRAVPLPPKTTLPLGTSAGLEE